MAIARKNKGNDMGIQAELKLKGWIWWNVSGVWFAKNLVGQQVKAGTLRALLTKLEWEVM